MHEAYVRLMRGKSSHTNRRGGALRPAATGGGMRPEEVRREVKRLEDERLRLAPGVTGGDPAAVAEDRRLEGRIRELARTEREARSD